MKILNGDFIAQPDEEMHFRHKHPWRKNMETDLFAQYLSNEM